MPYPVNFGSRQKMRPHTHSSAVHMDEGSFSDPISIPVSAATSSDAVQRQHTMPTPHPHVPRNKSIDALTNDDELYRKVLKELKKLNCENPKNESLLKRCKRFFRVVRPTMFVSSFVMLGLLIGWVYASIKLIKSIGKMNELLSAIQASKVLVNTQI